MKIKLKVNINEQSKIDDIKDAAVSKNKTQAYIYHDEYDTGWILSTGQFEIVEEEQKENIQTFISIRELLGQDMSMIEFK